MNENYKKYLKKNKLYKDNLQAEYELGEEYFQNVNDHRTYNSEEINDRLYDNKSKDKK